MATYHSTPDFSHPARVAPSPYIGQKIMMRVIVKGSMF
jgi:hypothetical protein